MSSKETLDLIWGAQNIADLINRTKRETFYLLATGQLIGAFKKGRLWCISRKDLMKNFCMSIAPIASVDAKLFAKFTSLMQLLSPEEQEEVLQYWTQAG